MELMDVTLRENIEYNGLLNYEQGLEYLKYVVNNFFNLFKIFYFKALF